MKSPEDKHKLIPSEDAPIVQEIFQRRASGESIREICDSLNKRNVITPSIRINTLDGIHTNRVPESSTWGTPTISQMFNNLVYIGHMAQGKRQNVGHKGKLRRVVDFNSQIVCHDTHEAIIPPATWDAVQNLRGSGTTVRKTKTGDVSLFAGIVCCATCGSILSPISKNSKDGATRLYRCSKYNNGGKSACSSHSVSEETLKEIVLSEIRAAATLLEQEETVLFERLYKAISEKELKSGKALREKLKSTEAQLLKINSRLQHLFEEKWDGTITQDMFEQMSREYEEKKASLEREIFDFKKQSQETSVAESAIAIWMEKLKHLIHMETLDRSILNELIDKIIVHEREPTKGTTQQKVEIHFKFIANAFTLANTGKKMKRAMLHTSLSQLPG